MDGFVTAHLEADGDANGPVTMGYFTREDLSFYYALADAFTICDGYFCSVLGPTDPNRVMSISASIDPAGVAGGPVLETYTSDRQSHYGTFTLGDHARAAQRGRGQLEGLQRSHRSVGVEPVPLLQDLLGTVHSRPRSNWRRGPWAPATRPRSSADVATGALPAVSWIMPPLAECEHPAAPPEYGEYLVQQILNTLVSNPDVWASTVFFVVYDENGGFFDHVPPPTPRSGTSGEWLTANPLPSEASGIAGPIGLGFRVPCLVLSPFSRGGYRCNEVFDHTSLLRFLETRFGVEVPNLTSWRRKATGDLTRSLDLVNPPDPAVPTLPATSLGDTTVAEQAVINALAGTEDYGIPYPLPSSNAMPSQEKSPKRPEVPR